MSAALAGLKIGSRVEWFLGPRRLRRTGTVVDINFATGAFSSRVDGIKTTPLRTVLPSCHPRIIIEAAKPPTELEIICAWCPSFDPKAPVNAHASHGICPSCAAKF